MEGGIMHNSKMVGWVVRRWEVKR